MKRSAGRWQQEWLNYWIRSAIYWGREARGAGTLISDASEHGEGDWICHTRNHRATSQAVNRKLRSTDVWVVTDDLRVNQTSSSCRPRETEKKLIICFLSSFPVGGFFFWYFRYWNLSNVTVIFRGTRQRNWLRHYATSQKVAASIPDEVIGFFNCPNPSSRTMALGSTQSLTEMITRNLPGAKGRPARKANNLSVMGEPIV
jgi:hypothetical protein